MFVFTLHKNGLKKAAVAVGCTVLLAAAAMAAGGGLHRGAAAAAAKPGRVTIEGTDDMVTWLTSLGGGGRHRQRQGRAGEGAQKMGRQLFRLQRGAARRRL